jgi:hypothetical protein
MFTEYKRRPNPVQAVSITKDNVEEVAIWCGGEPVTEIDALHKTVTYVGINVPTVNGVERASETDFIFKNPRGEICVERYSRFLHEYEES